MLFQKLHALASYSHSASLSVSDSNPSMKLSPSLLEQNLEYLNNILNHIEP